MLSLAGCDHPQEIKKEALLEKTRHWKEPKVATWNYVGSKDGRDFFRFEDLGIDEMFSVESGQIPLPRSFPITKSRESWLVMPWGPAAAP
ncbi:MAG TPA: hypothetical protein DCE44_25930 [Verrucomicrobiales bacterium]|nr:hypothetical protein [Verrucomicrobiales bacterium]